MVLEIKNKDKSPTKRSIDILTYLLIILYVLATSTIIPDECNSLKNILLWSSMAVLVAVICASSSLAIKIYKREKKIYIFTVIYLLLQIMALIFILIRTLSA